MATEPQKGDILTRFRDKTRDRCVIKAGCSQGSEYNGSRETKGTILQTNEFNGHTFYLVSIDGKKGPGLWYTDDCIEVKQGKLQALQKSDQRWCLVRKNEPDGTPTESRFLLDTDAIDSYIKEGFSVALDDERGEPPRRKGKPV